MYRSVPGCFCVLEGTSRYGQIGRADTFVSRKKKYRGRGLCWVLGPWLACCVDGYGWLFFIRILSYYSLTLPTLKKAPKGIIFGPRAASRLASDGLSAAILAVGRLHSRARLVRNSAPTA